MVHAPIIKTDFSAQQQPEASLKMVTARLPKIGELRVSASSKKRRAPSPRTWSAAPTLRWSVNETLIDQRPGAIGLTAGMALSDFRPAVHEDFLRVCSAAVASRTAIILADLHVAIKVASPPIIARMWASSFEAVVVRAVDVAAVLTTQVAADAGTDRAAKDCAEGR